MIANPQSAALPSRSSCRQTLTLLDRVAFIVGVLGFALLIAGIGFIYWPAALIVAGSGLLGWSYLTARAVARSRSQASSQSSPT
jgi:hypothetical protein